jgi:superfamily II DNA or RNA helicase
MTPTTYLSQRGYAVSIHENSQELCDSLRKDLLVRPFLNPNMMPATGNGVPEFPVYRESSKKMYMPKSYGLRRFGVPTCDQLHDGDEAPRLVFNGCLRAEQLPAVDAFVDAAKDPTRMGGIISLGCGQGKCLAPDTPILMHDGEIKAVQDVVIGDQLMGDNCTPRNVLSTCTGTEFMYRIVQSVGESYIINKSHILSLYHTKRHAVVDMSLTEYLKSTEKAFLLAYKIPVWYASDPLQCSIYDPKITYDEHDTLYQIGAAFACLCRTNQKQDLDTTVRRACFVARVQFMAGVIDSYAHVVDDSKFVLPYKSLKFTWFVKHVAGSVGFGVTENANRDVVLQVTATLLWSLPIKNGAHVAQRYTWTNYLQEVVGGRAGSFCYPFGITPLQEDRYYGFEIDGNRRFVLGDFTVTHNTVIGLNLACVFKKKTLIICHKEFLMNQWRERIEQFIPQAQVGIIKQKKVEIEDKDIVIASLQSLAMREYPLQLFQGFGFVVIDECHHTGAEVFSRALFKVNARITLGLSATLKRNDGLSKVFEWHIGTVVYSAKREKDSNVTIYAIRYDHDDPRYGMEKTMFGNRLNVAGMITDVTAFRPRNEMILDRLAELKAKEPLRKVLILSDRRGHLETFKRMVEEREGLGTVGFYVGGMKEAQLKESEGKDIILGTFQMASEGMDIPALDTLILASPISAIEQPVGRILRQKAHERRHVPTIIDVIDDYSLFPRQGKKRLAFYKKQKYETVFMEPEDTLLRVQTAPPNGCRRPFHERSAAKEVVLPTGCLFTRQIGDMSIADDEE